MRKADGAPSYVMYCRTLLKYLVSTGLEYPSRHAEKTRTNRQAALEYVLLFIVVICMVNVTRRVPR